MEKERSYLKLALKVNGLRPNLLQDSESEVSKGLQTNHGLSQDQFDVKVLTHYIEHCKDKTTLSRLKVILADLCIHAKRKAPQKKV